jgi:hypothetical protein
MQNKTLVIVGSNLALILVAGLTYSINEISNFAIVGGLVSLLLIPINGILSIANFVSGKKESGKAFLLATGLCLLIGFSLCASVGPLNLH